VYPLPHLPPTEISRKTLWLQCFTALLSRVEPDDALRQADLALELCDERWANAKTIGTGKLTESSPRSCLSRRASRFSSHLQGCW
jgi:hypothetical protein